MKAYLLFVFSLFTTAGYSQNTINNYKYVLVPAKFDFFSEDDKYGLNTTTKELLEQKGFTAFLGSAELPLTVATNRCNALNVEVVQRKGLFSTNLTLLLKDCQGNIIFKSKEGKSREKEYQLAYDLALRDAFSSLKDLSYQYDGTVFTQAKQDAATPVANSSTLPVSTPPPGTTPVAEITGALYAQIIPNGYQLIDTTPKKVLTLLKTSVQDYFIAGTGTSNGIVFKKNEEWYFEYYKDNQLVSKKLVIKF